MNLWMVAGKPLDAEPLNEVKTPVTHFPPCSATARTSSGGYAAKPTVLKVNEGMLQPSTGLRLATGGMRRNARPLRSAESTPRYPFPRYFALPQSADSLGGNSGVLLAIVPTALDHLCAYCSRSFRQSERSQGQRGLSIRPMAKSSRWC